MINHHMKCYVSNNNKDICILLVWKQENNCMMIMMGQWRDLLYKWIKKRFKIVKKTPLKNQPFLQPQPLAKTITQISTNTNNHNKITQNTTTTIQKMKENQQHQNHKKYVNRSILVMISYQYHTIILKPITTIPSVTVTLIVIVIITIQILMLQQVLVHQHSKKYKKSATVIQIVKRVSVIIEMIMIMMTKDGMINSFLFL